MILWMLKNMSPEKILTDGKVTLGKSLFTAYKKDWDKYYLVPSKYWCDTAKATWSSFAMMYWFWGWDTTCSDDEYKEILKEVSNSNTSIYLEIWNKTKLWFESKENDTELNWYIISSWKSIDELDFKVIPDQEIDKDEWFSLNYKKNTSIIFKLYAEKWDIDFKFDSKLDKDDRFAFIDYNWKAWNNEDSKFESVLKLENNKLNWNIKVTDYSDIFNLNIDWTTNTENVTYSLNIDYNLENSNNDILKWKFNYLNNVFSFENTTSDDYENTNIKIGWTYNPTDENLSALNIDLSIKTKQYGKEDFVENLKTNIILKDKIVSWLTLLKMDDWTDLFAIKTDWKYEKNYLELNNKIAFKDFFNKQIQKARDSTRITDLKVLQSAIEQAYQNENEYPSVKEFSEKTQEFLPRIPSDPLWNIEMNWCKFGYLYEVWDNNWIKNNSFRLSTCLESKTDRTKNDGWKDNNKLELFAWESNFKVKEKIYLNWDNKWYTTWTKKQNEKNDTYLLNANIKSDLRDNKNDVNIYIDANETDKKVFDFEIDNKGTREYKKSEIVAPTNTIDVKELLPSNDFWVTPYDDY
jgi:hypothetical protein